MSQKFEKLKGLLKTLFQLDQPDLDFGLYRIMHAKSAEITQFLDQDLLPQVRQAFSQYQPADKAEIQKALDLAIEQVRAYRLNPEESPVVKELRERLANEAVDLNALESEVYDHLYSFFRRYYDEGDFLSKRVYKPGVYAIPYEGEETKFTWANEDQYYIKTSEYLRDYAFRLRPEDEATPMRVHFRLVDAAEGEHGNVKAADGKERLFVLAVDGDTGHDFIRIVPGQNGSAAELQISFEYRPVTLTDWPEAQRTGKTKPPKQDDLRLIAVARILSAQAPDLLPWLADLAKQHVRKDGSQAEFSRLQAHLDAYTKCNTFDYFIHKNLGDFLRRELDFYIKNEMMHLDDIQSESVPRVEQYLSKIKVVRLIAYKIIDFVAQLEDFQKRLWLKKKIVFNTSYLINLSDIPPDLIEEVISNSAQRSEWRSLYGLDDTSFEHEAVPEGSSASASLIASHPGLMIDTRHFSPSITTEILDQLHEIDSITDGLLVHSDNFHALGLLEARYAKGIGFIYIDPPYNTDATEIIYKNGYKHSSWLSLLHSRLPLGKQFLVDSGVYCLTIDDYEFGNLKKELLDSELGFENHLATVAIRNNPSGRSTVKGFSVNHEYALFYGIAEGATKVGRLPHSEEQKERYDDHDGERHFEWENFRKSSAGSDRGSRPKQHFPLFVSEIDFRLRVPQLEWIEATKSYNVLESPELGERAVLPLDENGVEKVWRWGLVRTRREVSTLMARSVDGRIEVYGQKFLNEQGVLPRTWWDKAAYSARDNGTRVLRDMLGAGVGFEFPKAVEAVKDCIRVGCANPDDTVLDFFAGSGTSGHAVIELNRDADANRRFVLVEAGSHFDSVLVPRIKKATYAASWKDQKPIKEDLDPSSYFPRVIKVIRLESFEDSLNNIETLRSADQQNLLQLSESQGQDGFREQYLLKYILDVETRGSQSLLNVKAFADPTAYKLRVKRPGTDESREVNVDLLETFNWLVGLRVKHIAAPQSFAAEFDRDGEGRLRLKGRMNQSANGPWWFRRVEGTTPDGGNALIVWRKLTGNPEQDNLVLDSWMKDRLKISTRDFEFDLIYVNGDNNLENLKLPNDTWKVRLIEEDFHRLMFDTEGL